MLSNPLKLLKKSANPKTIIHNNANNENDNELILMEIFLGYLFHEITERPFSHERSKLYDIFEISMVLK